MRSSKVLNASQFKFRAGAAAPVRADSLSARKIFDYLDEHVIGQSKAKRVLAVAFRNRYRRQRLEDDFRKEIIPKNILMTGPTGSGKTELARRLAGLTAAPFIKVEATHYTEVGYYGKDVDSIIADLLQLTESKILAQIGDFLALLPEQLAEYANLLVLDLLLGPGAAPRELRRRKLADIERGEYDLKELRVPGVLFQQREAFESLEQFLAGLQGLAALVFDDCQPYAQYMTVKEFREALTLRFLERAERRFDVRRMAVARVEEDGIVFLDEIDKIASSKEVLHGSRGPSTDGVQRDLLPLMEGSVLTVKRSRVSTKNILFICAGAFSASKPSDLLPELLGRLPVQVALDTLRKEDYEKILTQVKFNLLAQYQRLLAVDGVTLSFEPAAVQRIAAIAEDLNYSVENLGARRLLSLLEALLEELSFESFEGSEAREVAVSAEYVDARLKDQLKKISYTNYLL